jgi:uncharacterized protein (TIGR03435 family)
LSERIRGQEIKGSPPWVNDDRYTIEAKAEEAQRMEMMRGPMMQALLEERFNLKMHRETREVPVYELSADKGGPKLKPTEEGSCIVIDRNHPPPGPDQPFPRICGGFFGNDLNGSTIANLCRQLSVLTDRDVIDGTGIAGVYDMHLDLLWENARTTTAATTSARSDLPSQPDPADLFVSARTALKKLGMRLEPAKASGEFLVIDHVEKPSEN